MSSLPPRVVFVTRETDYELLLAHHATVEQTRFFLATRGQTLDQLVVRHKQQEAALAAAQAQVPEDWRQASVGRDDLDRFLFSPEDLIVALGQDGLVANVAKYLTDQPVIGVNPDPGRYDGILVRFTAESLRSALIRTHNLDCAMERRTMVEGKLENGESLVALNELFIGHRSHQSARYAITVGDKSEDHSSSGVIVATGTGATGWARSIMLATRHPLELDPQEHALGWFVREPFPSVATGTAMRAGKLSDHPLQITSHMNEGGVIFADGIEQDFMNFGWGRSVQVGIARRSLQLVVG